METDLTLKGQCLVSTDLSIQVRAICLITKLSEEGRQFKDVLIKEEIIGSYLVSLVLTTRVLSGGYAFS
jgi:hypothetical protein